ncbi:DNA polymerase III subunit chi [Yoonia sp.]
MIRVLVLIGLLAACAPQPQALPDDFDSSFAF